MATVYKKPTRRTRLFVLLALLGILAAIAVTALLSIPIRSETVKARVIALLTEELESEVTIETLRGHVFPRVSVSGTGVVIRQKGRTDIPPLISIAEFEIIGSLSALMQHPRHVSEVRLRGLQVKISPGDDDDERRQGRQEGEVRGAEPGR